MIGRIFAMALAALGGTLASQAPEFTQQYQQRLGGAVDELARLVEDFDRSAAELGLDRDEALAQMTGTQFVERRRASMEATLARHERLSIQLADLRLSRTGIGRVIALARRPDTELARRTWDAFSPALPVTSAGLLFAAGGAAAGLAFAMLLGAAVRGAAGGRGQGRPRAPLREPPLTRKG